MKKIIVILLALSALMSVACAMVEEMQTTAETEKQTQVYTDSKETKTEANTESITEKQALLDDGEDLYPETKEEAESKSEKESETQERTRETDGYCYCHRTYFHFFSSALIEYVGQDAFHAWSGSAEKTQNNSYINIDCPYPDCNMYEFIHYFNVPKEFMIDFVNEYKEDYCVELLYLDDGGVAADKYYSEEESESAKSKEQLFFELESYIGSVKKFLLKGKAIDDIQKYIDKVDKSRVGFSKYSYNFDFFRNMSDEELEAFLNEHSEYYVDRVFCGLTPYESYYEMQCGEIVPKYINK